MRASSARVQREQPVRWCDSGSRAISSDERECRTRLETTVTGNTGSKCGQRDGERRQPETPISKDEQHEQGPTMTSDGNQRDQMIRAETGCDQLS